MLCGRGGALSARGRDQTLSRIGRLERRTRLFALPCGAGGLRHPVHVDDLAAAAMAVIAVPATHGQAHALPGGETHALASGSEWERGAPRSEVHRPRHQRGLTVNARKLHNLGLIALIVSYFLQFGAQLFAIAIIVRSVIAA